MNKSVVTGLALAFALLAAQSVAQNNGMSIGKGGAAPHKNAIFEAVSSDKGVLIPRLTAVQRSSIKTDATSVGLLVYDLDYKGFMYFTGTEWLPVSPVEQELLLNGNILSLIPGNSVTLPKPTLTYDPITYSLNYDGTIITLSSLANGPTGDSDPTNELQTLSITGNFLSISKGNQVELPSGITGADNQKISFDGATNVLTLEDGGTADLSKFATDLDPKNELQSLSIVGDMLSISDGNQVKLPSVVAGADNQALTFDGTTNVLTLEDGGTADLSQFATDLDPNNELQTLSITGNFLTISNGNQVELPSGITGADNQQITFDATTNVLTLEDGGTADLSKFATDLDPKNELQTLSIVGDIISISDGNQIKLPSSVTGADDQALTFDDATNVLTLEDGGSVDLSKFTTSTADKDADPANELQTISYVDDSLVLSLGGGKVKLLQTETDPLWTADKSGYYTKTQLQTSGSAKVAWGNLSGVPAKLDVDASDDFSGNYADLTNKPTISLNNNAVPHWNAATTSFANGLITDDGANVAIGGAVNPSYLLFVNGRFGSAGINELSDARFKTNVQSFTPSLSKVCQMRAVTYSWDTLNYPERNFSKTSEIGFIAQEVEALFPQLVTTGSDGYKTVQYSRTVAVLLEAIKELNAVVAQQQASITKLEASLESAEAVNARLESLQQQINILTQLMPLSADTAKK